MNDKIVKLLCVLVGLSSVISNRVNELKCEEFSLVHTDPRSSHPHLVEIISTKNPEIGTLCVGNLISWEFALVSARCVRKLNSSEQLFVRKFKLIGDEYSDSDNFRIKRLIEHELANPPYHDIGLIQLDKPIPYQNNTTIFRPACLWPHKQQPILGPYWIYEGQSQMSANLILNKDCFKNFFNIPEINIEKEKFKVFALYSCVIIKQIIDTVNPTSDAIMAQYTNQTYIIGISNMHQVIEKQNKNYTLMMGVRVSQVLTWIESIVWPTKSMQVKQFECGGQRMLVNERVTFAEPTYQGEFPWHVGIIKLHGHRRDAHQKYICGGTIITDQTILTAAHCMKIGNGILTPGRLIIVAGTNDLSENSIDIRYYGVKEVKVHEHFNQEYLVNDIAMLKLNSRIEFSDYIRPICISHSLLHSNILSGTVVGWGHNEHNKPSDVLLQATLPIYNNFECRDINRSFFPMFLNEHNYCAGYGNGTSVCSGDSGGAMIYKYESRWYIRGIVSLGISVPNYSVCDVTQPVIFTDVFKFDEWIMDNLVESVV